MKHDYSRLETNWLLRQTLMRGDQEPLYRVNLEKSTPLLIFSLAPMCMWVFYTVCYGVHASALYVVAFVACLIVPIVPIKRFYAALGPWLEYRAEMRARFIELDKRWDAEENCLEQNNV